MRAAGTALAIALVLGSAVTDARPRRYREDVPLEPDFWREVVEPHAEQVRQLVEKARRALLTTDEAMQGDGEWAVEQRMRYVHDAYYLMKYARTLSPENLDVLALLGRAADESGRTRQAIDALATHLKVTGPDRAASEVVGRLGGIYLRRGELDTAIRYLRLAQGAVRPENALALVHLANALATRGDVPGAIDVLLTAMPEHSGYFSYDLTIVAFTLAVIYDRDEQRGAAFDVVDRMKTTMSSSFGSQLQASLTQTMRYAPADDQHYYLGLLYEIQHQYVEARAEFALYAASGDTPWRARALEHVHDIDAERRSPRPVPPAPSPLLPSLPPVTP